MLSILIPIYAFDVRPFVKELYAQAQLLGMEWEIILFDDDSPEEWKIKNRKLGDLKGVEYKELQENIGRSAIRNALAQSAQYPYLLFMDCDSETMSSNFLQYYIDECAPKRVLYGGRAYKQEKPEDKTCLLHWYYGKTREVRSVEERNKHPHLGFMTNNFVIPKNIFLAIQLDERLKHYGHEDTLLGLKLEEQSIPIVHLNNPLVHIGLEKAQHWLGKQEQAIQNLYWLYLQYPKLSTAALKTWQFLDKFKMMNVIQPILRKYEPLLKQNLCSSDRPNLWQLNLLKILWLDRAANLTQ